MNYEIVSWLFSHTAKEDLIWIGGVVILCPMIAAMLGVASRKLKVYL